MSYLKDVLAEKEQQDKNLWKPKLSWEELIDFVDSQNEGFDEEELESVLGRGTEAKLELVPLDKLQPGPPESHQPSKKLEDSYFKKDVKKMPPLLIEYDGKTIVDGHHRYRVAKRKGMDKILVYLPYDPDQL